MRKSFNKLSTSSTAVAPRRVELKYDDGRSSGAVSSTPSITLLTTIANGTGASDRVGRKINYDSIEMSWIWRYSANHGGPNHARFTLVYDNAPNRTAVSYLDMFESTAVESLQRADTRGRFKFLFDSRCVSSVNDPAGSGDMNWTNFGGHKIISLKGKIAHFTGTSVNITDIEKGAIYLVTNSYQNGVVALDFSNRIQFSDV